MESSNTTYPKILGYHTEISDNYRLVQQSPDKLVLEVSIRDAMNQEAWEKVIIFGKTGIGNKIYNGDTDTFNCYVAVMCMFNKEK